MGFGAVGAAGAAAGAGTMPAFCSAAAPSATDGIWIVAPRTTGEVSLSPFAAASDRVVKLFAAAIDHRVSPGWTTWGTLADAGKIASRKKEIVSRGRRRMGAPCPPRAPATTRRADLRRPAGAGPRRR